MSEFRGVSGHEAIIGHRVEEANKSDNLDDWFLNNCYFLYWND